MKKINRKGFTLIELLAVIVILAIIALIATPIVMNIIDDSKKSAAERSAENYIVAVETKVASLYANPETRLANGVYNIMSDGNLCVSTNTTCAAPITIDMNGIKPTSGTIVIENSKVVSRSENDGLTYVTSFNTSGYTVLYNIGTNKYEVLKTGADGSISKICTLIKGNALAIGSKYECMVGEGVVQTFYVLEDGDSENATDATEVGQVSLIMDSNINSDGVAVKSNSINGYIEWISADDYADANIDETSCDNNACNDEGPATALNYLSVATSKWKNFDKVSLPTGQQIANAGGLATWASSNYDSTTLTDWLYDYLDETKSSVQNIYGYWTSTPNSSDSKRAWYVGYHGKLSYTITTTKNFYGIRPVVSISKFKI